jgi:peptide chain release factor subunit 1
MAKECFLKDNVVTVEGIIIAGSADLKTELCSSDLLDPRLQSKLLKVVDCEHGGESGFNQAVESSASVLGSVKMVEEKKMLKTYFEQIALDTGKVAYGIADTLASLEMGAAETIVVYEDLDMTIVGSEVFCKGKKVLKSTFLFGDLEEEQMLLTDWLAENHQKFGVWLAFISNSSSEGSQFLKGFGGIGAFLRWKIDFQEFEEFEDVDG